MEENLRVGSEAELMEKIRRSRPDVPGARKRVPVYGTASVGGLRLPAAGVSVSAAGIRRHARDKLRLRVRTATASLVAIPPAWHLT
jgi:hypothetical protein